MGSDLLAAALEFFCEKMNLMLTLLTTDITSLQGGTMWSGVETIYAAVLSMGITLANVFIWVEVVQTMFKYLEVKKSWVFIIFIIQIVLINAIIYYTKDILVNVISITQGMARTVMTETGMMDSSGDTVFHISVPDDLETALDSVKWTEQIALTVVIIVVGIWIAVSTITVLLTVYVRIFNIYLLIAISPLPFATAMSKHTRFIFINFLKSFLSVTLEIVVLAITMYLFKVFFENAIGTVTDISVTTDGSGFLSSDIIGNALNMLSPGIGTVYYVANYFTGSDNGNVNITSIFMYLIDMSFVFSVMVGMIKGSEKLVNKIFGV